MAFWCRVKQSQLRSLINQSKRCNFQIHGPYSANHTTSHTRLSGLKKPNSVFHNCPFVFFNNVRFFAAPVQAKPKQEEKDTSGPRLNEQITTQYVRLVTDEGHAVVSRQVALERARGLKLDLVEVQRTAKPPVCKLMDYHREKYKQQIKEKDRSKSKSEVTLRKGDCKEVRVETKIEQKDLQMKADMVKRLMDRGYRVKCMAKEAKGNESQDLGGLLARLFALIEDVSIVESGPRVEAKQAYVIVRHVKFGPSKKGSKKASKVEATSSKVQKVAVSASLVNPLSQSPLQFEGNKDAESGLETEDDILSEEATTSPSFGMRDEEDFVNNKSSWSVFDASDDFDKVFDVNGIAKSSTHKQMESASDTPPFPANNFTKVTTTRPVLDSTITANSSYPSEASLGSENRYKREPRNRSPPSKEMNVKGPDPRGSMRLQSQSPNQGRQPQFDLSTLSPSRETKHVQTDASVLGNLKLPADDFPLQERSYPGAPNGPQRYGMFNAPKINYSPEKQSVPAEVNRYKKEANPNSSPSSSNGSRRADFDRGGQGKWGVFRAESSDVIPGRNTERQEANKQR